MAKKLSDKLLKNHPNEKVRDIADELGKIKDLLVLAKSEGGKEIIKSLASDAISSLHYFAQGAKSLTHQEFIARASELKTILALLSVLTGAEENAKELTSILEDELG